MPHQDLSRHRLLFITEGGTAAVVSKARAELDAQAAAKAVMALGFDPLSMETKNRAM